MDYNDYDEIDDEMETENEHRRNLVQKFISENSHLYTGDDADRNLLKDAEAYASQCL